MITDWALFQFAPVNVRTAGFTVPSVGSELLTEIETAVPAAGLEFKVTENVAVPPLVVVVRPAMGVISTPTESTSRFVPFTVGIVAPVQAPPPFWTTNEMV